MSRAKNQGSKIKRAILRLHREDEERLCLWLVSSKPSGQPSYASHKGALALFFGFVVEFDSLVNVQQRLLKG